MSDTPRTEKELLSSDCTFNCGHSFRHLRDSSGPDIANGNEGVVVLADFARQLERELDAVKSAFEENQEQWITRENELLSIIAGKENA